MWLGFAAVLGILVFLYVLLLIYAFIYVPHFKIPPLPNLPEDWWGSGDERKEDKSVNPFRIKVRKEVSVKSINFDYIALVSIWGKSTFNSLILLILYIMHSTRNF